jgi:hypothetical protein
VGAQVQVVDRLYGGLREGDEHYEEVKKVVDEGRLNKQNAAMSPPQRSVIRL